MLYFQLLQKKSNFVPSRKQLHVPSLQSPVDVQISNHVFKQKRDCKTNEEMRKCTTKAIQADLGIFTHIQARSGIIQASSEPCVTLAYSELWYIQNPSIFKTRGIFRTLLYPKLWHIYNQRHNQNPGLFRTLGYSEPEAYSEPSQISTMEHFEKQLTAIFIFGSYNYFSNISFSRNKYDFFNSGLIFTPEVLIQCKKSMQAGVEGPGTVTFDIPPRSFTVVLLLTLNIF